MSLTEQGLLAALANVIDPHTGKDFVSTRAVRNVQISGGDVAFDVELGYPAKSVIPEFRKQLIAAAKTLKKENGEIRFSTPNKNVFEVLRLSGLLKFFKVYPDNAAAIRSFTPK